MTQEQLAQKLMITPQAVSKWENDLSCPDVTLLKRISRTFGISVDELLDDGEGPVTKLSESESGKGKILKLKAIAQKDRVNINLPIALLELLLQNGSWEGALLSNDKAQAFSAVDFKQVLELASFGVIGKILEVQSEDGAMVEVWVE